ncbi:UNKNOWN [Stylonychia lemnae]|uniref:Uncharacterized protein n=1 Tax=Stylonychia lemnae TaxID=5949 RepID=A0A078AY29_STYLE|nr:UNKNOWN [Stylonychia lemnae]|eukprot:CDW87026.1 UNKNOWN [Stylonychia lemnae]
MNSACANYKKRNSIQDQDQAARIYLHCFYFIPQERYYSNQIWIQQEKEKLPKIKIEEKYEKINEQNLESLNLISELWHSIGFTLSNFHILRGQGYYTAFDIFNNFLKAALLSNNIGDSSVIYAPDKLQVLDTCPLSQNQPDNSKLQQIKAMSVKQYEARLIIAGQFFCLTGVKIYFSLIWLLALHSTRSSNATFKLHQEAGHLV